MHCGCGETAARRIGAGPLVRASATVIPLAGHSIDVVICSMMLMIVSPIARVLARVHQVLAPGGHLVATIPASKPLRARDLPVWPDCGLPWDAV